MNDQEDANLTELVEKFWKKEGSGIQEDNKATYSDKSKRQLRFMEKSIEPDEDRYKKKSTLEKRNEVAEQLSGS